MSNYGFSQPVEVFIDREGASCKHVMTTARAQVLERKTTVPGRQLVGAQCLFDLPHPIIRAQPVVNKFLQTNTHSVNTNKPFGKQTNTGVFAFKHREVFDCHAEI